MFIKIGSYVMATPESTQPEDYSDLVFSQDKGRNYLFYIVIVLFVLIVIGYFSFFPSEQEEIDLEPPKNSGQIDPVAKSQVEAEQKSITIARKDNAVISGEDGSEPINESTSKKSTVNPGEAARSLISEARRGGQQPNLEELFDKASAFQKQGMMTDAFLLYFFAARKGDGSSAFELASMHDPAFFKPGNDLLDAPDTVQAYKWYSIAAEHQVVDAQSRLSALRESVESAAAKGDLSAQRLLLNWK